jgi:hypothetical protein
VIERQKQNDPSVFAGEALRRFDARKGAGATTTFPGADKLLVGNPGWTSITLQFGTATNELPVALLTARDGSSQEYLQLAGPGAVRVEIARFVVSRPWLDPAFLQHQMWRRTDTKVVSTGENEAVDSELLPYIPTEVYLIKNVSVDFPMTSAFRRRLLEARRSGSQVSVAGLTIAGQTWTGESNTDTVYQYPELTESGLKLPAIQFLGWRLNRVSKSPRPADDLIWPDAK